MASLLAGLSTGLGALPLLIGSQLPRRLYDGLLGFSAGVMLSAAVFSLILPALDTGGLGSVIVGIAAGTVLLYLMDRVIPHLHAGFGSGELSLPLRQGMLMAGAIAIHNFPEGFAVGAGYSSALPNTGLVLTLAIAIQNIPEGLAVAAPFRQAGISKLKSLAIATASGLAEPVAALLGIALVSSSQLVLPFGLAFAGGAMLYVVSDEIIPESHSAGNEHEATFGIMLGFLTMLILQELFSG